MLPRGAANLNRDCAVSDSSFALPASMAPKCFPPNAVFMHANGRCITASQLKRDGGEILLGPNNTRVRVVSTRRYEPEKRAFLKIFTSSSMLEVTDDHRVLGQCPRGTPVTVTAVDLRPLIITGTGPQPVDSFDVEYRVSEVVEPIFENDAPVLVWTRSGRRQKNVDLEQAFAVRGGLCDMYSLLEIKNDFYDGLRAPGNPSIFRSRSADSNVTPHDQRRLARARSRWPQPCSALVRDMDD